MRHANLRNTLAVASLGVVATAAGLIHAEAPPVRDTPNSTSAPAVPTGAYSVPIAPVAATPPTPAVAPKAPHAVVSSARLVAIACPSECEEGEEYVVHEAHVHEIAAVGAGDESITITINNGDVRVILNGERIPEDRIRTSSDGIDILDAKGNVIKHVDLQVAEGRRGMTFSATPRVRGMIRAPQGEARQNIVVDEIARPPVMLGITMNDADKAILEHLGVGSKSAIVIESVLDGLPAKRAGLRPNDIIVSIDGKEPANQDTLRKVLRAKSPGDELVLKLVRQGDKKSVVVALDEYDAGALGVSSMPGELRFNAEQDVAREQMERAREQLERSRRIIEQQLKEVDSVRREEIERSISQAMRALEVQKGAMAREQAARQRYAWAFAPDTDADEDEDNVMFFAPPATVRSSGNQWRDAREDLEELEERFDELEDRLERIDEKLDRLLDRNP